MKSAGLKLYVLPWFSFPSSTEIASSFFRGADLQVRTTCWPATRLQTSVPAWTGGTTANAVPRISCIFKPADFLHVRAAVHITDGSADSGRPPVQETLHLQGF